MHSLECALIYFFIVSISHNAKSMKFAGCNANRRKWPSTFTCWVLRKRKITPLSVSCFLTYKISKFFFNLICWHSASINKTSNERERLWTVLCCKTSASCLISSYFPSLLLDCLLFQYLPSSERVQVHHLTRNCL